MKLIKYITHKLYTSREEYRRAARADEAFDAIAKFEQYMYPKWKWVHDKDWDVYDEWRDLTRKFDELYS